MFNGQIESSGPRYCPSIEDKITRFASKDRHQIFVEPEGWNTVEVYVNGFSTSLPMDVQFKAIRAVKGFEGVKMFRPGYAIEYDYFPPTQLDYSLETKIVEGLFFAGQINGTTGYEEAACQGLMAGINAHNKVNEKDPFVLGRSEAYIGVLIDDLITKGTEEPYRMFTSRAEHRILLRQDNADIRLTERGYELGLADEDRMRSLDNKLHSLKNFETFLAKQSVEPVNVNPMLVTKGSAEIKQKQKILGLVSRPNVGIRDLINIHAVSAYVQENHISSEVLDQLEIGVKYKGYLDKAKDDAEKLTRLGDLTIPDEFDYYKLKSMSYEGREKLSKIKPRSIRQASNISGVSPSDINVLMVYMGR